MPFKWKYLPSYVRKVPAKLRLCFDILRAPYFRSVPPGHFYSPLPDMKEVDRRAATIFGKPPDQLPGLEFNIAKQKELLDLFRERTIAFCRSSEALIPNPDFSIPTALFRFKTRFPSMP